MPSGTAPPPTLSLELFMDRFRVEQIIIRNLMTNAAKIIPEGRDVIIRFLVIRAANQTKYVSWLI